MFQGEGVQFMFMFMFMLMLGVNPKTAVTIRKIEWKRRQNTKTKKKVANKKTKRVL